MKYNRFEGSRLEFKEKHTPTMLKTVSAFANYEGGTIIVGISDDGEIIGVEESKKIRESIEQAINDSIEPRPNFALKEEFIENKTLVVIEVYPGDNPPYMYKSETFKRSDTSTVKVDRNELIRLNLKGKNVSYDSMVSPNQHLTFRTLENEFLKRNETLKITKDVLITLRLLSNSTYNIAGLLISDDNDLDTSSVDLVLFGNSTNVIIDRVAVEKASILTQLNEANLFFNKHYPKLEVIEDRVRVHKSQIPDLAFREAIANAIIHRDYLQAGSIKVACYDNRIEITSLGGLVEGMSESAFYNDNLSILRNPIIAQVFRRLGLIEAFGTGIGKIINTYKNSSHEPVFIIEPNFIKIILPNMLYDDTKLSNEEKILNHLSIYPSITRNKTESILNISKDRAHTLLSRMVEDGQLKIIKQGPNSFYEVKKPFF